MKLVILLPLLLLLVLLQEVASEYQVNLDKLDNRYVSQLRVEVRHVLNKGEQCKLFWKGLRERLEKDAGFKRLEPASTRVPVDLDILMQLSERLQQLPAYQSLGQYVYECYSELVWLLPSGSLEEEMETVRMNRPFVDRAAPFRQRQLEADW